MEYVLSLATSLKQILFAHVIPQGAKTVKNLGYTHPQDFICENPDWLLNHEIYIPRKFPGIRYISIRNLPLLICE